VLQQRLQRNTHMWNPRRYTQVQARWHQAWVPSTCGNSHTHALLCSAGVHAGTPRTRRASFAVFVTGGHIPFTRHSLLKHLNFIFPAYPFLLFSFPCFASLYFFTVTHILAHDRFVITDSIVLFFQSLFDLQCNLDYFVHASVFRMVEPSKDYFGTSFVTVLATRSQSILLYICR
jgi:hypothetical protein